MKLFSVAAAARLRRQDAHPASERDFLAGSPVAPAPDRRNGAAAAEGKEDEEAEEEGGGAGGGGGAGDAPSFAALGVSKHLCSVLAALGISAPTPVQAACIPPAFSGQDIVGIAQTGSGKTAAFAVPILQASKQRGDVPPPSPSLPLDYIRGRFAQMAD